MFKMYCLTRSLNQRVRNETIPNVLFINSINNINTKSVIYFKNNNNKEGEKYMKEIIKNFNSFNDYKNKKRHIVKNSNSFNDNKKKNIVKTPKTFGDNENKKNFKVQSNFPVKSKGRVSISIGNIFDKGETLEDSFQDAIDIMLKEKKIKEARDAIINFIKIDKIPKYSSLKILAGRSAQEGDSYSIQVIQSALKTNYSVQYKKENCFEHYYCEALFREGDHKKSLQLLISLIDKATNLKRIKESACYIMRMVPIISEECQDEAFKIVRKFISQKDEYKPAVVLWTESVSSKQYNLHCQAEKLIEEYSELLNGEERNISNLIEEGLKNNDTELLHRLMEAFLKLKDQELLTEISSAILNLYCMTENLQKGSEILNFAKEEHIYIKADILVKFGLLLKKVKYLEQKSISERLNNLKKSGVNSQENCVKISNKSFKYKF